MSVLCKSLIFSEPNLAIKCAHSPSHGLKLVSGRKFTLVGTPVGQELKERPEDMPDVMNDLDIDVSEYPELMKAFANDQRNTRKIKEAVRDLDIHIMNEPREGKRLLVLDLDYSTSIFPGVDQTLSDLLKPLWIPSL